jgi:hypothetical protein
MCSLKDFCSHHSESFDGRGNHICAENWLNNMDELLATFGCTNEQKVAHAAYKLTGEAKCWWQDKKVVLVADLGSEITISLKVYKHKFNQHFFPRVVQEAKAQEFLDLVQGGMSVIEYAAKFLQLSCFGLYLILTEEKKAKMFEQGLNSCIQIMMSCFDIRDFSQLVDRASIYKESLKENAAEYADQKRRTQGIGTLVGGAGPAKRMAVGSFPPRGHKDVPLVTLQFHCRRIRHRSCARSITVYIRDPTRWQPGLTIDEASLAISARIAWAKGLLRSLWRQLGFMRLF